MLSRRIEDQHVDKELLNEFPTTYNIREKNFHLIVLTSYVTNLRPYGNKLERTCGVKLYIIEQVLFLVSNILLYFLIIFHLDKIPYY